MTHSPGDRPSSTASKAGETVASRVRVARDREESAQYVVAETSRKRLHEIARMPPSRIAKYLDDADLTPPDRDILKRTLEHRTRTAEARPTLKLPERFLEGLVASRRWIAPGIVLAASGTFFVFANARTAPGAGVLLRDATIPWVENGQIVRQSYRRDTPLRIVGMRDGRYVIEGWLPGRGYARQAEAGPDFVEFLPRRRWANMLSPRP